MAHVVFGLSGAGSLRQALAQIGRDDRVLGFPDDLSFGPIDPVSSMSRQKWTEDVLGFTDYGDFGRRADLFWDEIENSELSLIVWVNRHCTLEYAGFLEFLWRIGDRAFEVVDITDVEFRTGPEHVRHPTTWKAIAFGQVTSQQMIDANLFSLRRRLSDEEIAQYRSCWQQLKAEDAPLRVICDQNLCSAPLTYFDNILKSNVTEHWQSAARIVGQTLGKLSEDRLHQCGDLLLWSRLCALAHSHIFESKGDFSHMRQCHIRLRSVEEGQLQSLPYQNEPA